MLGIFRITDLKVKHYKGDVLVKSSSLSAEGETPTWLLNFTIPADITRVTLEAQFADGTIFEEGIWPDKFEGKYMDKREFFFGEK